MSHIKVYTLKNKKYTMHVFYYVMLVYSLHEEYLNNKILLFSVLNII